MEAMNRYFTYGLNIHSNVELPLWPAAGVAANQAPDIVIERMGSCPLPRELPEEGYEFHISPGGGEFLSQHVGSIQVSPGRPVRMEARPLPDASGKLLAHFLSGSALALAIFYRGFQPLHGCALRIGGETVVFMGLSGTGKSSLCAALCMMGHQIITDDISPVCWIDGRAHVMPGYPQMKLNSDIVDALGIPREELVPLHEIHPKVGWFRPGDRFDQPQPVDSLFFLGIGKREIRPLTGLDAFVLTQRHATPSQWGFEGGKDHFVACSRLIKEVPAYAFIRERSLDGLMDQAEWISSSLQAVSV
jgi:hypothetical protein